MRKNSALDEMQELELLKIEHNGCWIAFWGLLIALAVQSAAFGNTDFRTLAGEWAVFMVLAVYLAVACMRRGIWEQAHPHEHQIKPHRLGRSCRYSRRSHRDHGFQELPEARAGRGCRPYNGCDHLRSLLYSAYPRHEKDREEDP